jgi:hypothetical protein
VNLRSCRHCYHRDIPTISDVLSCCCYLRSVYAHNRSCPAIAQKATFQFPISHTLRLTLCFLWDDIACLPMDTNNLAWAAMQLLSMSAHVACATTNFSQSEMLLTLIPTVRPPHSICSDMTILTRVHIVPEAGQKEILTSWSLFILICLLISALIASYVFQTRRIQAVHETVMSIFAGNYHITPSPEFGS